jgi:hypothetical protein
MLGVHWGFLDANRFGRIRLDKAGYSRDMPGRDQPTWGFHLQPRAWPGLLRLLRETPDDTARAELGITPVDPYRPLWLDEDFDVLAKSEV